MDNLNEEKISKTEKHLLHVGLILSSIAIIFFSWAFIIAKHVVDNNVTLHELIKNGDTKSNQIVYLKVTEKPYIFAEYDSNEKSNKYYFLLDENYMYIGYLDYNTYKKINSSDLDEKPITIKGITKKTPDDVINIAIATYNKEIGEEILTKDNYKNYIGDIYIDTVNDLVNNTPQLVLGTAFSILAIIYFISYIIRNIKINKTKKSIA